MKTETCISETSYKGYRAVELMERLECRWLVRIVESGLELEVYEDELISEF